MHLATLREIAAEHGVTYEAVRVWAATGKVTTYRLPGRRERLFLDREEVREFRASARTWGTLGPDAHVVTVTPGGQR